MDGGAWWATVHGVAKSQARLRDYRFHFQKEFSFDFTIKTLYPLEPLNLGFLRES